MKIRHPIVSAVLLTLTITWPGYGQGPDQRGVPPALVDRAVGILRQVVANEQQWVKVHAAENLLRLGYGAGVKEDFLRENRVHGTQPPYRIGIWRVLARASKRAAERARWIDKIRAVFLDATATDRLHAAETLAKLDYVARPDEVSRLEAAAQSADGQMAAFCLCVLVHSGHQNAENKLAKLLAAPDPRTRVCAAYALRHVGHITPTTRQRLLAAAAREAPLSPARVYMLAAAFVHGSDPDDMTAQRQELRRDIGRGEKDSRREAIAALAKRGDTSDLPLLIAQLDGHDADVRATAADAVLHIGRRVTHRLQPLDWAVIALYAVGMLAVGWYYSQHSTTTEDYLLGSRQMRPLAVGLSMFATLLSTLTYLAVPGEMIKHGPIIASQYIAFPFIFLVIGFLLIPRIMRLKVTSAYEILEAHLGLTVRMFGSLLFLSLRFLWMGLIIYATSSKVLVPLLQWDQSAVPYVCAVMGLITVIYTSMGGLRAVVMTDVVQTMILLGGAVLTLVLITVRMGGVAAWWPTAWAPDWDPLRFGFDPRARLTVAGAVTSCFVWYVSTSGSDQVAIQRYLATRDPRSARRVLLTSLCTDCIVGMLLATLGLALWSYFSTHPEMLPDAYATTSSADTLFPRFILIGLPTGISGLVVAGLLAAAMSSLSSGVNSSSSVIAVDLIDRFRATSHGDTDQTHLHRAKLISVFVGVAVILLSIAVGHVSGNLLAVTFRVVNLLTAPLFILFAMALFVPWATSTGTIIGGVCSTVMAIGVAFAGWFGLSFIWIMPVAFLTGIITGPIASLIPFDRLLRR